MALELCLCGLYMVDQSGSLQSTVSAPLPIASALQCEVTTLG